METDVMRIEIVTDSAGGAIAASKGGKTGGKSADAGKGIGPILSGVLHGVGIATGIGLIIEIVGNLKSLVSVVQAIFKMVMMLLRPIEMIIVTLLMPILFLLKPIISLVNKIMSPYITLAMQMMKAGVTNTRQGGNAAVLGGLQMSAATGVLMAGLNAVMVALVGEIIKQSLNMALTGLGILLGAIFPGMDAAVNKAKEAINSAFNGVMAVAQSTIASAAVAMAESVGVDTGVFQGKVIESVKAVFYGGKNIPEGVLSVMTNEMELAEKVGEGAFKALAGVLNINLVDMGKNGIIKVNEAFGGTTESLGINGTLAQKLTETKNVGKGKLKEAVDAWNKEFDRLNKPKGDDTGTGGSKYDLLTKAGVVIATIPGMQGIGAAVSSAAAKFGR